MVHIKIIHLFQHGLSFYFLAFCDRIPVYMFKHEQAQIPQRLRGLIRHNDIVSSHTVADDIVDQVIQALSRGKSQRTTQFHGNIFLIQNHCTDRIVNIGIDICNLI